MTGKYLHRSRENGVTSRHWRYSRKPVVLFLVMGWCCTALLRAQSLRMVESFDHHWAFLPSDIHAGSDPALNDRGWVRVDLPHDWAIEGPFAASNPSGGAGAFAPAGIGWYRKHFTLARRDAGRHIFIEFDGIMANSDVWINGFLLGHRPNGYVSLRYE